jgi:calmodulin
MAQQINHAHSQAEIIEALKVFDRDGQGFLHAEDLRGVLSDRSGEHLSPQDIDEILRDVDPQNSGKISIQQFVQVLFNPKITI